MSQGGVWGPQQWAWGHQEQGVVLVDMAAEGGRREVPLCLLCLCSQVHTVRIWLKRSQATAHRCVLFFLKCSLLMGGLLFEFQVHIWDESSPN